LKPPSANKVGRIWSSAMTTSQTNPNRPPERLDLFENPFSACCRRLMFVQARNLPPYAAADFPSEPFLFPRILEEDSAYRGHFARIRMNSCTYAGDAVSSQLRYRPIPPVPRRLQPDSDQSPRSELRRYGPLRQGRNSEPADNTPSRRLRRASRTIQGGHANRADVEEPQGARPGAT
jgi:hypothetical protein